MKHRFTMTMLAVAIAVFSAKVQAMAPVISYLPSPVIADDSPVTGSRIFVYPDAMDLATKANDPDQTVTPSEIIWSYTGAGRYQINGLDPMDIAGGDDPNAPGAKAISANDSDPQSVDSNPMTITLRDATLSPISGGDVNQAQTPGTPTIVGSEVVTLFASDGSTYSMKSMMVYTEQDGTDRLSGSTAMIPDSNEAPSSAQWTTAAITGINSATFSTTGGGLCLGAPLTPDTYGGWVSPYGYTDLVQNAVYRFRLTMSSGTALPAGTTPLWDFVIDNFDTANPTTTQDKFGFDYYVLDNENGANAPGASSTYDVWFTPTASLATDWNDSTTGEFSPALDAKNDMRLQFRMLDTKVGANNADLDQGTLCLRNLEVSHIGMDQLSVQNTVWSNSNLAAANTTVTSIFGTANTTVTYSGGNVSVSPNTGGTAGTGAWNAEVIDVVPGDATSDTTNPSTLPDNWPVAWETGQLLRGTISIQATSAAGETNPPDGIALAFDTVTTEFSVNSYVSAASNTIGLPKLTPTDYVMFFYTQNQTATTIQNGKAMRLKAQVLLTPNINAGGSTTNVNGIQVNSMKVDLMAPPSN